MQENLTIQFLTWDLKKKIQFQMGHIITLIKKREKQLNLKL